MPAIFAAEEAGWKPARRDRLEADPPAIAAHHLGRPERAADYFNQSLLEGSPSPAGYLRICWQDADEGTTESWLR